MADKIKITVDTHTHTDKRFKMRIGGMDIYVDYDDVDHALVDAMTNSIVEVLEKNWDRPGYLVWLKAHRFKEWENDKDLKEEYPNFEDYFKQYQQ